ncbi:GAF domain-containing protein [Algoriphagus taiwanensis]|uniref:GAF domain-containing protein n=1 Tax=Algoriphagus taiwanensis TaxID=1445656 RepID=A0ABQ6PXD8_9BACT|nr:hypothetical protein Ataiwa_08780 [Algoriphagus taiwanensis]
MDRLAELQSYAILDTDPEVEMNEIAEMAKAIFNTPISVVSFIDDHRQWYKAKIGVDWSEVPIEDTFCRFTMDSPEEVLLILDPLKDERVSDNPYVTCPEGIRFYVSAPIVSTHGNILGTLCAWDQKKHQVKKSQLIALKLLAKRVSISLETRKVLKDQNQKIELFGERLRKITELSPGALFKLNIEPQTKDISLDFLGGGIARLIPGINPEDILHNPSLFMDWVIPRFRFKLFRQFIKAINSNSPFEMDIPICLGNDNVLWLWIKARPEVQSGEINFYGTIQDIGQKIAHIKSIRKILFDISHKLRAPIAKMKGILSLMDFEKEPESLEELTPFLFQSSKELDAVIYELNNEYSELILDLEENN